MFVLIRYILFYLVCPAVLKCFTNKDGDDDDAYSLTHMVRITSFVALAMMW